MGLIKKSSTFPAGMPGSALEDLKDISSRLSGIITFTIIRFVYGVCALHLSSIEIILFSAISVIFLSVIKSHSEALSTITEVMLQISVMVASQATVHVMGVDVSESYSVNTPVFTVVQTLSVVTGILVLASVIPEYMQDSDLVQRCVTLVLFTYADAMESLFSVRRLGSTPSLICVLVYMCLHKYDMMLGKAFTVMYLIRALNMVTINFILRALVDVNQDVASIEIQTCLFLTVLFFLDVLGSVSSLFAETRDYAMWKVSLELFQVYKTLQIDLIVSLVGCLMVLATKRLWSDNTRIIFQLIILLVLNVVLDTASVYLQASTSVDKSVLLFIYIIGIHHFTDLMFVKQKERAHA